MSNPPANPKIYHITHINNLESMLIDCRLESDSCRITKGLKDTKIGMDQIKLRRLSELEVGCHPGTKVGEYIPFYFCPRSIMLYILHMGNHPGIDYLGGQTPIIHLQADLMTAVEWANENSVKWAFSDRNAGSYITQFFDNVNDLKYVDWDAVSARDFRDMIVKEGKQAEFLVYDSFPISLVEKIGVVNTYIKKRVDNILMNSSDNYRPNVSIELNWYY